MGILKSTTNLVANAKYKCKRFLWGSYLSSLIGRDVPVTGGTALAEALWYPPNLKPCANISSNSLLLAVEHVRSSRTRCYSVISTEGGSFNVLQDNPPNFSMLLRSTEYCPEYARGNYYILGSCNKWMLLKCKKVLDGVPYEVLWNPTTNEVRPLPFFAWPPLFRDFRMLEVEWDCHSIGFDPASEDYKVVRYGFSEDPSGKVQVQVLDKAHAAVFSLKNCTWKRIPYTHCRYIRPIGDSCVHINGISYWIALDAPTRLRATIVSFDFTNEKFPDLIPLPESDWLVHICCLDIVEFRGSLAAVVSKYQRRKRGEPVVKEPFEFEIWVWNDGWSFHSTYNVPLDYDDDDDVCVDRVHGLYKNDKALFQDSKGSLLLYDCRTRVLKDLGIREEICFGILGSQMRVYPYVEST